MDYRLPFQTIEAISRYPKEFGLHWSCPCLGAHRHRMKLDIFSVQPNPMFYDIDSKQTYQPIQTL